MKLVGDWAPENIPVNLQIQKGLYLANLESPFLPSENSISPKSKAGPNLYTTILPSNEFNFIFSLANNHIMDFGELGLEATISELNRKGFPFVGISFLDEEYYKPIVFENNGSKIGIVGLCESQFGVNHGYNIGVSSFNQGVFNFISDFKQKVDFLIVSFHGGAEVSPWPSPKWQDVFRLFISSGADIVHGHHSHIPKGFEVYKNGLIFYGLGNFVVNPKKWLQNENFLWSIIPELSFQNKNVTFKIKTSEITQNSQLSVNYSNKVQFEKHIEFLKLCNEPLRNRKLLNAIWQETSLRFYYMFYQDWINYKHKRKKRNIKEIFYQILRKENYASIHLKRKLQLHYNLFICETHVDAISTALGLLINEIEDIRTNESKNLVDYMMPWTKDYKKL